MGGVGSVIHVALFLDTVLREETQQQRLKQPDLRPAPGSRPTGRGRDGGTIMVCALQHLLINHSLAAEWQR